MTKQGLMYDHGPLSDQIRFKKSFDGGFVGQHTWMFISPTIKIRSYFGTISDRKSEKSQMKSLGGRYLTAHSTG